MFSWLIPVFWITIYGLFWKRSRKAAEITLFGTWIVNFLWTFTPIARWIGIEGIMNAYVTLALSLVLGIVTNLIFTGEKALFAKDKPLVIKTDVAVEL